MVVEGVVLLGVEHLQQSAGGVAAEVAAELVDFIEEHQRIAHPACLTAAMMRPGIAPM